MKRIAFITWLCFAALAYAVDPPKVPTEVKAQPGLITVRHDNPNVVECEVMTPGLSLIDPGILNPDFKGLAFIAMKPGRFRVFCWTAAGDVPSKGAWMTVIVGDPGPDPDPDPDDPLIPIDEFERGLFSAWKEEPPTPAKVERIRFLSDIYREAATLAENSQELKTVYQLYQTGVLGAVQNNFKPIADPAAEFVVIRKLIGSELNSKLSTKINEPLDPNRAICAKEFRRVANALNRLEGVR